MLSRAGFCSDAFIRTLDYYSSVLTKNPYRLADPIDGPLAINGQAPTSVTGAVDASAEKDGGS